MLNNFRIRLSIFTLLLGLCLLKPLYSDVQKSISLINSLYNKQNYKQTVILCNQVLKEKITIQEKYNIYMILGKSQYELWKPEKAIETFTMAEKISTNQNKETALFHIAKTYFITKKYQKAEESFNKLITTYVKSNKKPQYYYYYAKSLKYQNKSENINIFQKIIKEYPESKYKKLSLLELKTKN